MTEKEHENKTRALKARATRLKNKAKRAGLLADKVELYRQAKEVQAQLQEHRHNFYSLTANQ